MTSIRIEEHFDGKERDLADAAAKADRAAITRLIAAGANPNFRSAKGMPLLLWPMHKQNPDGFAALLEGGASANQTDHRGSPVTTFAAKNPDMRYLEALLRAGANANARNTDREPLTFVAAMQGNWEHVKLLIERGADIDAFNHENYGDTLLAYYAYGQFERALWLLERGADPTFKIKDALAKNRIGTQPILELIFHYKIDAKAFPQGVTAQKKCQEFVIAKGIKPVPEPNYLKAKS
jgi:ankyrin repeat protein